MNRLAFRFLVAETTIALTTLMGTAVRAQQDSIGYPNRQVAEAEKRYADEPTVQDLVSAALKATAAGPEQVERLVGRAHRSGWVPKVRLAVRRRIGSGLSAYQTIETDRMSLSSDDNLVLEASLTFDLDKLVYQGQELTLAKEKSALEKARYKLAATVVELYFERRKLQIERDLDGRVEPKNAVRIAEIEALLDIFTNGEFGRMIGKKKPSSAVIK